MAHRVSYDSMGSVWRDFLSDLSLLDEDVYFDETLDILDDEDKTGFLIFFLFNFMNGPLRFINGPLRVVELLEALPIVLFWLELILHHFKINIV